MDRPPKTKQEIEAEESEAEHKKLVESGKFDAIPIKLLNVGDVVAIRGNATIHEVFEINEKNAVVGYNHPTEGWLRPRKRLPLSDIRDATGYLNARLEQEGAAHRYEIRVEGRTMKARPRGTDN